MDLYVILLIYLRSSVNFDILHKVIDFVHDVQ